MIVSFSVSNFRSFSTEETFSLVASNRLVGDHENHAVPIPHTTEKVLRTGVLYGANGAGKSNLFKALNYLRSMILAPRKKNSGTGREPFLFDMGQERPSVFDLQFVVSGKLYRFGIKVDDQHIVEEWLVWIDGKREKPLYERMTDEAGRVVIDAKGLKSAGDKLVALATIGGPQNQTFLATIKATLDAPDCGEELNAVLNWFEVGLMLIDPHHSTLELGSILNEDEKFLDFVSAFLRSSATGVDHLSVTRKEISEEQLRGLLPERMVPGILKEIQEHGSVAHPLMEGTEFVLERADVEHYYMLRIQAAHQHQKGKIVNLDLMDESDGTRRLLHLIPWLFYIENTDSVLVIDEIDRSMHPMLVWKFLEFFLNSREVRNHQIIVTTHESNLLDLDLLRRDEIWFAEKDQKGATKLYSLADYRVRKDLEIRKHYLQGRFGAVPFLGNLDRLLAEEEVPV